jgi:hypothetical protein
VCLCTCANKQCCKDQQFLDFCAGLNATSPTSTLSTSGGGVLKSSTVLVAGVAVAGTATLGLVAWLVARRRRRDSNPWREVKGPGKRKWPLDDTPSHALDSTSSRTCMMAGPGVDRGGVLDMYGATRLGLSDDSDSEGGYPPTCLAPCGLLCVHV